MKKYKRPIIAGIAFLLIVAGTIYATTFKYLYTSSEITLAQTLGFGGAAATASNTINTYTGDIDLETNGFYGMWISIQASSSNATDDLVISYYASPDGTNFDSRGNEFWTVSMDGIGQTASQTTFQMFPAPPHGRIGLRSSAGNTTFGYNIKYIPAQGDGS